MKSCPAIHLYTLLQAKRGVYLPYFPTFQRLYLKKKIIKNSQNSISFLCVTNSFYRWAFWISKSCRDPWGMRNRKMQCHLQHGWLQRNRSLEHGCAINSMFTLRQPSQMPWSTVPRENSILRGNSTGVSSFWECEGWCVRTNTLVSIFAWALLYHLPLTVLQCPHLVPPQLSKTARNFM